MEEAEIGDANAQFHLATLYDEGDGITQDKKKLLSGTKKQQHKGMRAHKTI